MVLNKAVVTLSCVLVFSVCALADQNAITFNNHTHILSNIVNKIQNKTAELIQLADAIEHSLEEYKDAGLEAIQKQIANIRSKLNAIPTSCLARKKNKILDHSFNIVTNFTSCKNLSNAMNQTIELAKSGVAVFAAVVVEIAHTFDTFINCTKRDPFVSFHCILNEVGNIQNKTEHVKLAVDRFVQQAVHTLPYVVREVVSCFRTSRVKANQQITAVVKTIKSCY